MTGLPQSIAIPAWWPDARPFQIAAACAMALAMAIVLAQFCVLLLSAYVRYQEHRRDAFNAEWRPRMGLASIDGEAWPDAPAPRGARKRVWWLMLWNRMQRQLRGESKNNLNREIRLLGMQKNAARLLHGHGAMRKLVALETFRHLAEAAFWDDVEPLCRERNPFVVISAAHALVAMDPGRAMRLVMRLAVDRKEWGIHRLGGLCKAAGPGMVTPALLGALNLAKPADCVRLAPLLAYANPVKSVAWVRATLPRVRNPDILVPAIGVLAELGDPRDHGMIVANLSHENRDVRLAAVKALHRQARPDDIDLLLPMLRDTSWWVRRETADTLAAIPGLGAQALPALLQRVDDRFGRDELARAFGDRRSGESP